MKKSQVVAILLVAVVLAAILMLVGDFNSYSTFKTASEDTTKTFKIIAKYDSSKATVYEPLTNSNRFIFYAKDNNNESYKVIYNDSEPQDFKKSEQLVMTGKMENGTFYCSEILMKCPSKYQDKNGPKPDAQGYINAKESKT